MGSCISFCVRCSSKHIRSKVTVDVLHSFLGPNDRGKPEATALELRSTPRATPSMSKQQYVEAVLRGIAVVEQGVGTGRVGLILSVDRRMNAGDAAEIVDLAAKYVGVVGVDLCGDMFRARDLAALVGPLSHVKAMGKGLTMHLYEVSRGVIVVGETDNLLTRGAVMSTHTQNV